MAAFEFERDWPLVAAIGAGVAGVVLLARGGPPGAPRPVVVGGTEGGYQAALSAQVALEQTRMQTQAQLFGTLAGALVQREQTEAAVRMAELQAQARMAEIQAQLAAIRGQQAVQQQANLFGLIGAALPFIFRLFCEQTTRQALVAQAAAEARWPIRSYALAGGWS